MTRRVPPGQRNEQHAAMYTAIQELIASGQAGLYGRNFFYQALKRRGILVTRDRMFEIVKQLDPIGVMERTFNLFTSPRGNYRTPGPNFVWSIDGHLKLQMYGIEIYAAIDAYSR